MRLPELGRGVALAAGKTNLRIAGFDPSGVMTGEPDIMPTPLEREEFFTVASDAMVHAATYDGARWGLIGVPGPTTVEVDDADVVTQNFRITNIPDLGQESGFDPIAEMSAINPEFKVLVESGGFTFLMINDGDLAVQAGAALFATGKHNMVADIIDGSGTGGALAERSKDFKTLFHPVSGRWELGHLIDSLDHPTATPENTISGTAFEGRFDKPIRDLDPSHPVFPLIARQLAKIAVVLSMTAAPDLIVISGGIGIEAQDQYRGLLLGELQAFAESPNPMADQIAKTDIVFPPISLADIYELYGAPDAMRSHLVRRAVSRIIREAA